METYVPSPQSLYLRCTAESLARLLSGKANMRRTCCSLNTHAVAQSSCCNYRMPMCIGSFSYTRSRLVSQSDPQFVGQFRRTSPFPPSGNEGYIRNRDVFSTIKVNVDQQLFGYPDSSKYLLLCSAQEIN